mgnify:CR=1 FL=1
MEENEHKRRVRYSGTHPKEFQEKYKELAPEKYADDVEKIINSGKTPAGMHRSICVNEIMEFLQITPGQTTKIWMQENLQSEEPSFRNFIEIWQNKRQFNL